jgi:hypothetical protein
VNLYKLILIPYNSDVVKTVWNLTFIKIKYLSHVRPTELTNSMEQSPSFLGTYEYAQLVKKFPSFYGTRRFITVFTRARHLSLS